MPNTGAVFQEAGLLVSLNELALPLSVIISFAALLLPLDQEIKLRMLTSARELAETLGGATIDNIDDYYQSMLSEAEVHTFY